MDPNANLREQREIAAEINAIRDNLDPITDAFTSDQLDRLEHLALRLAELVEALDEWLNRGGFLPRRVAPWHAA